MLVYQRVISINTYCCIQYLLKINSYENPSLPNFWAVVLHRHAAGCPYRVAVGRPEAMAVPGWNPPDPGDAPVVPGFLCRGAGGQRLVLLQLCAEFGGHHLRVGNLQSIHQQGPKWHLRQTQISSQWTPLWKGFCRGFLHSSECLLDSIKMKFILVQPAFPVSVAESHQWARGGWSIYFASMEGNLHIGQQLDDKSRLSMDRVSRTRHFVGRSRPRNLWSFGDFAKYRVSG